MEWPKGKEPPKYSTVSRSKGKDKVLEHIKVENLQVNLTSGVEQEREERERQEKRRKDMAKQNMMPDWYVQSAIGQREAAAAAAAASEAPNGVKAEDRDVNMTGDPALVGVKKEEPEDEKKPDLNPRTAQESEYAEYLAEMEREAEEQRRKEEAEDEGEEDDDEGEFQDVVPSEANTPSMSQSQATESGKVADVGSPPRPVNSKGAGQVNGIKREREFEDDDESSEANTPADMKRVKVEETGRGNVNGIGTAIATGSLIKNEADDEESEEDEGDFEDAM